MATTNLNIRTDAEVKAAAEQLFNDLGMNLTTAVNIFLRQAVREQAIPFRVGAPMPNAETLQAIQDARRGVGLSRGFTSVRELMEDLDADD